MYTYSERHVERRSSVRKKARAMFAEENTFASRSRAAVIDLLFSALRCLSPASSSSSSPSIKARANGNKSERAREIEREKKTRRRRVKCLYLM